ncbi:hypothetical protein LXL04_037866 [Taraxacum kok-saghyz]
MLRRCRAAVSRQPRCQGCCRPLPLATSRHSLTREDSSKRYRREGERGLTGNNDICSAPFSSGRTPPVAALSHRRCFAWLVQLRRNAGTVDLPVRSPSRVVCYARMCLAGGRLCALQMADEEDEVEEGIYISSYLFRYRRLTVTPRCTSRLTPGEAGNVSMLVFVLLTFAVNLVTGTNKKGVAGPVMLRRCRAAVSRQPRCQGCCRPLPLATSRHSLAREDSSKRYRREGERGLTGNNDICSAPFSSGRTPPVAALSHRRCFAWLVQLRRNAGTVDLPVRSPSRVVCYARMCLAGGRLCALQMADEEDEVEEGIYISSYLFRYRCLTVTPRCTSRLTPGEAGNVSMLVFVLLTFAVNLVTGTNKKGVAGPVMLRRCRAAVSRQPRCQGCCRPLPLATSRHSLAREDSSKRYRREGERGLTGNNDICSAPLSSGRTPPVAALSHRRCFTWLVQLCRNAGTVDLPVRSPSRVVCYARMCLAGGRLCALQMADEEDEVEEGIYISSYLFRYRRLTVTPRCTSRLTPGEAGNVSMLVFVLLTFAARVSNDIIAPRTVYPKDSPSHQADL